MRRAILLVCVFALAFAGFGAPAAAAPGTGLDIEFELSCPGGIQASGHLAGYVGAFVVEDGQNVPVPGVAFPWAFVQDTYKYDADDNLVDTGVGEFYVPGTHPGSVTGCTGTLWVWTPHPLVVRDGIAYEIAYFTGMELTFRGAPS